LISDFDGLDLAEYPRYYSRDQEDEDAVVRTARARKFCENLIFRADVIGENKEISISVGMFGYVTALGHLDVIFQFVSQVNDGTWGKLQKVRSSTKLSLQTAMQVAFDMLYGGLN
jgi:hypothetical protein